MRSTQIVTRRLALWWVYTAFAVSAAFGTGATVPPAVVAASFGAPKRSAGLHEPIYIEFSVHNGTRAPIHFDLGKDREGRFEFSIGEPGGKMAGPFRLPRGGPGTVGKVSLAPAGTYTQKILLNEWYQFEAPGDYKVQCKLIPAARPEPGEALTGSRSEKLYVHIGPRNTVRLEDVCRSLATTALNSSSDWRPAVTALSYIPDLIAVPFLEEVAVRS